MKKLLILFPLVFSSGCAFSFGVPLCEPVPIIQPVIHPKQEQPKKSPVRTGRLNPSSIVLNR